MLNTSSLMLGVGFMFKTVSAHIDLIIFKAYLTRRMQITGFTVRVSLFS